jgi:hypothetical protein
MDNDLMLALIQAANAAAAGAQDPQFKAMCADLASQLAERAKTMGVDPATAAAPASESPEALAKRAAAKQAGTSAGDAAAVVSEEDKRQMAASRGAALSLADVQRVYREERAKEAYIKANASRPGMTDKLIEKLASRSLAEVRELVDALPPAPAGTGTAAPVRATPMVASAAIEGAPGAELTPEEKYDIKLLDKAFGTDPVQLQASREAATRGEAGVISVRKLEKLRLAKST